MKICNNVYTSTFVNQRLAILERELAVEAAAELACAGASPTKLTYVIVDPPSGTVASYTEIGISMTPIIGYYKPFLTDAKRSDEEAARHGFVAMRYIDLLRRVVNGLKIVSEGMPKCSREEHSGAAAEADKVPAGASFESFWDAVVRNNAPQRRN